MRDFLCKIIWSCENNVLYLPNKFISMKPNYLDVLTHDTIGCLSNKSSVALSFETKRSYSPKYIYLDEYQANELLQKLTEAINKNREEPLDNNIKRIFKR